MKALLELNPLIWKYRGRLFLGMVFVVFTNMFAVWAPSMIGEGINALNDANMHFLAPMAEGESPTLDQLELPRTLAFLADTRSVRVDGSLEKDETAPNGTFVAGVLEAGELGPRDLVVISPYNRQCDAVRGALARP